MRTRLVILLGAVALLAAACGRPLTGDGGEPGAAGSPTGSQLSVQVASFDHATGEDQRLLVGLFVQTGQGPRPVVGGQVDMEVYRLPDDGSGTATGAPTAAGSPSPQTARQVAAGTGEFVPVPGKGPQGSPGQPRLAEGGTVGVYQVSVDLAEPGYHGVRVLVDVADRGRMAATATLRVNQRHQVPAVGDRAPAVDNPTVDSPDVPAVAIDSRAQNNDGQVPDPALHDLTVAGALANDRPTVLLISTPVYCLSQFCGPITERVEALQQTYGDRADFVHLEVWRNYEDRELNPAAAEYIETPQGGGNEPWTFLIGADGIVDARWGNVLNAAELERMLRDL